MGRGIYVALSGGIAYQRQLEIASNNLANVSTTGYKADRPVFGVIRPSSAQMALSNPVPSPSEKLLAQSFASIQDSAVDLTAGGVQQTGNELHLAIKSDGFFEIRKDDATVAYTRAGQFHLNSDGVLVTPENYKIQGNNGEIRLSSPGVSIDSQGNIYANGALLDRLKIVRFGQPNNLTKVGHTYFDGSTASPESADSPGIMQGALERSNSDAIRSILDVITVERNFEAFTKVVGALDNLDSKATLRLRI